MKENEELMQILQDVLEVMKKLTEVVNYGRVLVDIAIGNLSCIKYANTKRTNQKVIDFE